MGKKKDIEWFDKKMKDLKKRKRAACAPIPEDEYNAFLTKDGMNNNKTRKQIKEEFKKEQRSYKRAEKRNWKKEAEEIINNTNNND